ncbi:putative Bgh-specific protein [Blumeria hordei DH14]|uniref:Putative Bgh-specific protein n=1 Tax=Blumeria graminis f. sp. hordei (strain DH14) TaxID=546991 RepID=N1J781_BLUG1|nr:putative Bgh-specific protein [Blumeria hordei DH14]
MLQKSLLIGLTLPAAHALSLSDFQRNLPTATSKACKTAYESQISACTQSDFIISCSTPCVSGLISITKEVMEACRGLKAESNYLLGLVLGGRMVESLCQPLDRQKIINAPFDPLFIEQLRFAGLPRADARSSSELSTLFLTTLAPNTQREPKSSAPPLTTQGFTILHLTVSSVYKTNPSSITKTTILSSPAPTTDSKPTGTTRFSTYTSETVTFSIPIITNTSQIISSTKNVISELSTTSFSSLSSVSADRNETLPTSSTSTYKPSVSVQTTSPKPNIDSGGGSPFDVQNSSGNLTHYNITIIISTICFLMIAVLQY